MRRFYYSEEQRQGDIVVLDKAESHHIHRVLRLPSKTNIELCSRQGEVYAGEIYAIGERVEVKLLQKVQVEDTVAKLTVGQALIKSKKMELVLQKATELGVDEFFPVISTRTQGNLLRQAVEKEDRWRRITEEACKQCLRAKPMFLHGLQSFTDLIWKPDGDNVQPVKLLLWEKENAHHLDILQKTQLVNRPVILLFGPEGGFTEEEVTAAKQAGWSTISLGKRILRSETASLACVAIVQHYLGNM